MTLFRSPRFLGLVALLAALAADQAHKFFMLHVVDIGARQPIALTPFLEVVLSWNYGVSYSMFAAHDGAARAALLGLQAALIAGLLVWLWRAQRRLVGVGLGLIVGGALGNAFDRLTHGAVADFFYFHTSLPVGPLANYIFNVADVAITFGVVLLALEALAQPPARPA